ncbi:MAG: 30S ribosomal protein S6 [Patescibacteria group bacterium]|nr:30S ribosomal protein S6 [Patescibacteria group bacterium]
MSKVADQTIETPNNDVGQAYELGYLLSPLVPADKVGETVESVIKQALAAVGAKIVLENDPRMIPLAYPIKQVVDNKGTTFREAYFGTIYFDASADVATGLAADWQRSPMLIRHLLIKNSPPAPQKSPAPAPSRPEADTPSTKPTLNRAVIDREIEDLLTEADTPTTEVAAIKQE